MYITTITINVVSEAPGNMWLRAPFIGMNAHYPFHTGTNQIYISPKLIQNSNATIENKTIHLLSDIDIVVNVITAGSSYHAEEGFLALPRLESATQFIVATGIPYDSNRPSEILIASYENTTTVSLTYPQGLTFDTVSVNLSEYKTYMFRSMYDLSGTYIQSSRPISVIAGNTYTMPIGAYVSYTIEQVPPTDFLGNEYLVPPLRSHSIYKLKILSPNYNAVLTLQNSTGTFRFMLYSDLPLAVFNKNEPAFISSSKPIMVVQFGLGFMTTVPSISNYLRRYDFLVPTITASVVNYVCIISTTTDDIVLDSVKPTGKNISFMNTTKGNFTVMTTSVAIGRHSITSMSGTLYFGAILYGYTTYTGYAFPLGLRATSG